MNQINRLQKQFNVGLLFFLVIITSSFSLAKAPTVWCSWKPTTSNIQIGSMDNCNGTTSQTNIVVGTGWVGTLNQFGCSVINITNTFSGNHPAGTLRIKKNGVEVRSHAIAQNQNIVYDDTISAVSGDNFEVLW